jgi:hypothetical protein
VSSWPANVLLSDTRDALVDIGYHSDLVVDRYGFADLLLEESPVRTIDLAAFGHDPPSYRSACLALLLESQNVIADPMSYLALGAPNLFVAADGDIRWWEFDSRDYTKVRDFPHGDLPRVIREASDQLAPYSVLRSKAISSATDTVKQMDLYDAGLVPELDRIVQTKLDSLVQSVLRSAREHYRRLHGDDPNYGQLFRTVFRLLMCKVLADRGHRGLSNKHSAADALESVASEYSHDVTASDVISTEDVVEAMWDQIRRGVRFQNVSVETLAHIYENTLVDPEARKRAGIHSTPAQISEYIVWNLPIQEIPEPERRVFEPFVGSGSFLVSALSRLKSLLPPGLSAIERHERMINSLSGADIDTFALEVARLSLVLADYPNTNGWVLYQADAFTDPLVNEQLMRSSVVITNPPFGSFSRLEVERYGRQNAKGGRANRAATSLEMILDADPQMIGIVLPRNFLTGIQFREQRKLLLQQYGEVQALALPDKAFLYSEAETVLITAFGRGKGKVNFLGAEITPDRYQRYARLSSPPRTNVRQINVLLDQSEYSLPIGDLLELWEYLQEAPRLADVAAVHRGVEFIGSVKNHVSSTSKEGFHPGLPTVKGFLEPYYVPQHAFLDLSQQSMRTNANLYPWHLPKLIANASRLTRGKWRITAAIDRQGLVCTQRFHGIWPDENLSLEVLAAVINHPVANAFLSDWRTGPDNQIRTIQQIPLPNLNESVCSAVRVLVENYRSVRSSVKNASSSSVEIQLILNKILMEIDAQLLRAYDLPPKLERKLLTAFASHGRPGGLGFSGYPVTELSASLPLHLLIDESFTRSATAAATSERLRPIDDPEVSDFVRELLKR